MPKEQIWTCLHELKVLLIYEKIKVGEDRHELCEELSEDPCFVEEGISYSSINLKIGNIEWLDTEGKRGLHNVSNLNREVFEKYKNTSIKELEQIIKEKEEGLNMNEDEIKKKQILDFLREHPGEYFGAGVIDRKLGFDPGYNHYPTHRLLQELLAEGLLEQRHGSGFRIKNPDKSKPSSCSQEEPERSPKNDIELLLENKIIELINDKKFKKKYVSIYATAIKNLAEALEIIKRIKSQ